MTKAINVEKVFGARLYGRYEADGNLSGEVFRRDVLIPGLLENERLQLDFSAVVAAPSSFFEEAFGGLVRDFYSSPDLAKKAGVSEDGLVDLDTIVDYLVNRIELYSEDEFISKKLEKVMPYMKIAAENLMSDSRE